MFIVTPVTLNNGRLKKEDFRNLVDAHVKGRSEIVNILGDMYYKELDDR